MATFNFTLRGDQIATFASLSGNGNGVDRVVTLTGVNAIGSSSETFTVVVTQAAGSATQFTNGQLVTIYDSIGNVVMATSNVQPDAEQGLGAGDEHLIFSNGFVIDVGGFDAGTTTYQYSHADEAATSGLGDDDGELDFADTTTSFPCFAAGTLVRTPSGEVDVRNLSQGDLVETLDHGPRPIAWIATRKIVYATAPKRRKRPTLIAAAAFGPDCPYRDLVISAQHRVAIDASGRVGHRVSLSDGMLAPSHALLGLSGIREKRSCKQIVLISILFDRHEIIRANGVWCESFYPGRYSMATLPAGLRREVLARFPMLRLGVEHGYGLMARPRFELGRVALLSKAA